MEKDDEKETAKALLELIQGRMAEMLKDAKVMTARPPNCPHCNERKLQPLDSKEFSWGAAFICECKACNEMCHAVAAPPEEIEDVLQVFKEAAEACPESELSKLPVVPFTNMRVQSLSERLGDKMPGEFAGKTPQGVTVH